MEAVVSCVPITQFFKRPLRLLANLDLWEQHVLHFDEIRLNGKLLHVMCKIKRRVGTLSFLLAEG